MKNNRLINEKSPYLLQHAHNPVDWYPWGTAAFEKAKREDKPILVSIGYSTCHWCHVMEKESFEDPETAKLMNDLLVSIKVDREERPDVDKVYMTAVSAMTGQGGWPLNAFLTPDLKPIYGGTYFPPEARWGHPSWKDVVKQVGDSWKDPEERKKMLEASDHISASLERYVQASSASEKLNGEWLDQAFQGFKSAYDSDRGGFSSAPKFPMPVNHHFLQRYYARSGNKEALDMSLNTLRAMARGGIYDQIGGGFARYSTDAYWHIPHFEKMLYDNAQLAVNYLEAYQITKDEQFKQIARETLDYVKRVMTSSEGAFYSAEDADSLPTTGSREKSEGAFYVWGKDELSTLLGEKVAAIVSFYYGVRPEGNAAQDPHQEFVKKNILYVAHPIPEVAREFKLSLEETGKILEQARRQMFESRSHRPRPHLDDKVIAAWNGLMISAFARSSSILNEPSDLQIAERAASFLEKHLYEAQRGLLYRRWRENHRDALGIADDYAFVVQGLLDLYEADFNPHWLKLAQEIQEAMIRRFYDPTRGGFFMTAKDQDPSLILRFKEDQDNVEPSASSVGVLNLLRLSQYFDTAAYHEMAIKSLESYAATMKESPRAMPTMLSALDFALTDPRQIVIAGNLASADTQALLRVVHRYFLPVKVLAVTQDEKLGLTAMDFKPIRGKATAYVCEHFVCKKPTSDPDELSRQLEVSRKVAH